jgi:aspartate carbamoyltransferase catalytic subunit
MYRLGGKVIELNEGGNNSLKKGETISDTLTMMGLYTDIMAIRSPYEGTAKRASEVLDIPVINAGDGANQHPTQTLLDLYTIQKEKGKLDNLNIAFVGDLKYGRTVHSLAKALDKFSGNKIYFIAPPEIQIPSYILDSLSLEYEILEDYEAIMKDVDILYMTRIQEERFDNTEVFKKCAGKYKIDKEILKISKSDLKILHPLPRVGEIHINLDSTPNAIYFSQAKNGVFVRQAIISLLMKEYTKPLYDGINEICTNPKCISQVEDLVGKWINFKGEKKCFYCEK